MDALERPSPGLRPASPNGERQDFRCIGLTERHWAIGEGWGDLFAFQEREYQGQIFYAALQGRTE